MAELNPKPPSPQYAVHRGLRMVNAPVVGIMLGLPLLAGLLFGSLGIVVGFCVAFPLAWCWWSYAVPRRRDWVIDSGLTPEDVQPLAVKTGLLWPAGHPFERTEFRRRDGKRGW